MKKINNGSEFLNFILKDLKDSISSREISKMPVEKITDYLEKLERIHNTAIKDEHKMNLLKHFYYEKYIIKTLPDNYIKFEKGYIRQLGFNSKLNAEQKQIVLKKIQKDQKESLDKWIDYLCSNDLQYPTWFKYYIFQGVVKVGNFYPTLADFTKRSNSTTSVFLDINHNIINQMYNILSKKINNQQLNEDEQRILESGMDFKNLYISLHLYNKANTNSYKHIIDNNTDYNKNVQK